MHYYFMQCCVWLIADCQVFYVTMIDIIFTCRHGFLLIVDAGLFDVFMATSYSCSDNGMLFSCVVDGSW